MKLQGSRRSRWPVLAIAVVILVTGVAFGIWNSTNVANAQDADRAISGSKAADTVQDQVSDRYIVVFREDALAGYDGKVPGYPKPARLQRKSRIDVKSQSARRYVAYLERRQADHEGRIAQRLGRPIEVTKRMQHALNAIVMRMSASEAALVSELPDVYVVDPVRDIPMDTDVGPLLIGAETLWNGTPGQNAAVQGEGMVIGVLDSGINFGSPSFAAIDPVDGYQHINPLGSGTFLGTCAPGGVDAGRCNAKLIGGYDFVCMAPGNTCGAANIREEPGFGDTNGHGSHTASTVAGNRRDISILTAVRRISGVAPRANVIAYDVCYTNTATGQGLCPNVSSATAVNQAIADGVVDAINFSIGGGTSPWTDAVSLAFLNATDAGIYVATSAGNDGPGPNTMGHLEPWTASTAAAQHGRAGVAYVTNITGPGTVPAALTNITMNEGVGGVAHSATINAPLIVSPNYTTTTDSCSAFPAGTFAGAIALVARGGNTCTSATKINNATAAGAIAVIIAHNNGAQGLIPATTGTTVPAFAVSQNQGAAMRTFAIANPGTTASIPFPAAVVPNQADQLAAFSSRGPAANFDLVKPNMTAPGVNVLAAVSGTAITGSEQVTAFFNGTSMASPHNAGSSLLLRQLRPTWTVSEVKSALEMTAEQGVTKEDGTTQASPHDMGSGRIRVNLAANAALVMNEVKANFQAANPATGGNISTLNLPSMAKRGCIVQCQFVRTFRSTLPGSQSWSASLDSLEGTVSPSTFTVAGGGTVTLTITIDSSNVPTDGAFHFGRLVLEPVLQAHSTLGLPIAITVPPPAIALDPPSQNVSIVEGAPGSASFDVRNVGGADLNFDIDQSGNGGMTAHSNLNRGTSNSGFRSGIYTDNPTPAATFASDDFNVEMPTTLTSLYTEGFVVSNQPLASVAQNITWSVFPDNNGAPAGNPHSNAAAAVWSHTAAPNGAGVTLTGANIRLDLPAAAQSITLQPGRYWLVVSVRSTLANRWAWFASNVGTGTFVTANSPPGTWAPVAGFSGLMMQVEGTVPCGAPWIGASMPGSGTLVGGASQSIVTQLSAAGLTPGNYLGAVCVASNDPVRPKVAELLRLAVTENTPPTISDIADTSTSEDTSTPAIPFTIGDAQTAPEALTVAAVSSNQSVVADSGIALGGSGASRQVVVSPVANANGFSDITITVTDTSGATASDTFRLTVNPGNDPPTIVAATGITRQQAAGASVSQIATVADIDSDPLTVTVNNGASATVNGVTVSNIVVNANGTVNASIAAGCGASNASFTLRVTDPGALFAQATLNVSVTVETTPPVINPIANVVATLPAGSATSMPVAFPLPTATDNCPGTTVTTVPVSGSTFGVGTTTVNVTATDAVGNTATSSFTVWVQYPFTGFGGRIQNPPAVNFQAAGNTLPINFSLGGSRGLNIFTSGSPSSRQVTCPAGAPIGLATPATLSPSLFFQKGQYTMYWQTDPAWAGTCRQFSVTLNDGTTRNLNFSFFQ